MNNVKQLLETKGRNIWSVDPETSVYAALELMAEKSVGALVVMKDGSAAGVVSERDYARKVVLIGRSSLDTPVSEIMTADLVSVRPEQTVDDCMRLMTDRRIRHLLVMNNADLIGVISIGDLVKAIIAEQQQTIEQLERYIAG